jgi:3-oxoisoapionate-4-phosphate decarboxylase
VKYWEPDESFVASFKAITTPLFSRNDCPLPVAGSGQWGGQAHDTYHRTGRTQDLMYLCGGGIVSHPGGAGAGVKAVKQAWDAAVAGIPLETYARDHKELAQSIATFANGKGA